MTQSNYKRVRVIDSHTGGEPTRVVVDGGPDLGSDTLSIRLERFRNEFDDFRSAVVNEPRGSDAIVGALLCEPVNSACTTGVIFFNNVAYLGMCGHGTIGLITTLAYLNRIGPGEHLVETPVGIVKANLLNDGQVEVENVPSYRLASAVTVQVPGYGSVTGDVAWGGNWFFLVNNHDHDLSLSNIDTLTAYTWSIREALSNAGITGADGHEIDHVELFVPSKIEGVDSKNFVLCPGKAYDRSPCGTGTSAKLACLFEDGKLKAGQVWRQESLIGSLFEGQVSLINGEIHPKIKGSAFITAEADLIIDERDPFCMGIRE